VLYADTHTHTHTRARARTHTHTHTHKRSFFYYHTRWQMRKIRTSIYKNRTRQEDGGSVVES
jgi:hypothetical protein